MEGQRADLIWRTGDVPVSTRFDDPYFSLDDGLAETHHVFLAGNGLPDRFKDGFHIAELGFGTGLNALAVAQALEQCGDPGRVRFTSFEAFPMERLDMARALSVFPQVRTLAEALIEQWGQEQIQIGRLDLEVIIGDARQTVKDWPGSADAWFLDGFAPAKNPELWEPELLNAVARHTQKGGTAATYSAAGAVRRALQEAGFTVERVPGFGRKRHMVQARLT